MQELQLYNTLHRKKEKFVPIEPGKVKLYTCGLTVYNYAHIGNLRTYIFEDLLKRTLQYNNYDVLHVMNITDIGHLTSDADKGEDKMVLSAKKEHKSVWEIAEHYTQAFEKDLKNLNIDFPDYHVKATNEIPAMIELIKRIEDNGFTYKSRGNVYFDISKYKEYGKLAKLDLENLQAGARIEVDNAKKNPHDFVLWFTKSKFDDQEMKWDSPWGKGYPGWHIECAAISMKYLGDHFDIHCGGIDHIPVHHTNEIAQAEAATGEKWVNYWLHGEFLIFKHHKMSKSSGEFLTLDKLQEKGYSPLVYRYFCLGAHYRKKLTFSYESLDAARESMKRIRDKFISIEENLDESFGDKEYSQKIKEEFISQINNDLNIPGALAVLWEVLKTNEIGDKEKFELILDFDKVLGLNLKDSHAVVENKKEKEVDTELVEKLLGEREEARQNKNWSRADEIRKKLDSLGVEVRDGDKGTEWRIK